MRHPLQHSEERVFDNLVGGQLPVITSPAYDLNSPNKLVSKVAVHNVKSVDGYDFFFLKMSFVKKFEVVNVLVILGSTEL